MRSVAYLLVYSLPLLSTLPIVEQQPARLGQPIEVATTRREFLIGEPVLLLVKFKNLTGKNISILEYDIEGGEPQIEIFMSQDNKHFERLHFGLKISEVEPTIRTLKPNGTRDHVLRVLYSRRDGGTLFFKRAGSYFIKVIYPLVIQGGQGRMEIESNVVSVAIKTPAGADAQVWQRMQHNQIYSFLQSGSFRPDGTASTDKTQPPWADRKSVLAVASLLDRFSDSGYRDAFRWALRKVMSNQELSLTTEERRQIQHSLGVEEGPQKNRK